jgi:hypothetical protein
VIAADRAMDAEGLFAAMSVTAPATEMSAWRSRVLQWGAQPRARLASQASMSRSSQPTRRAVSRIGLGKVPALRWRFLPVRL